MLKTKFLLVAGCLLLTIVGGNFYIQYFKIDRAIFFNVGQGDSSFFRTGQGETVLIDGGPNNSVLSQLGKFMPFWERDIDLIILTHPHADHVTGLVEILKRYQVKKIIMTGVTHTTPQYLEFLKIIKEQNIPVKIALTNEKIEVGDVKIEILFPLENLAGREVDDLNNTSIVARIDFLDRKFLMMGDAEFDVEEELVNKYKHNLKSDVLKVSHHGSHFSTSAEFLSYVSPSIAVISVGENSFGHPSPRTLNRLKRAGIEIRRTDVNGNIVMGRKEKE